MSDSYRYSRWDGTQQVFDIDAEELMEGLSQDLLSHGDVWRALREMMRRGFQDRMGQRLPGLQELLEQLRSQRQSQIERYNVDSVMEGIRQRLDEILQRERQGIQRRLSEARQQVDESEGEERAQRESLYQLLEQRAQRNLEQLDSLPQSSAGAIRQLMDYEFMDPEAQRQFQELLNQLRGRMLENFFQDLKQQLRGLNPQDLAGLREMLRQLNQMLRDRALGREPDFQGFMQQFGAMFGPNPPQDLDELLERLQRQIAQAQSLLESMSPEMRRELEEMLDSVLDPETQQELAELATLMGQFMPMDDLRRQYPFMGEESLTLDQAMELMGQFQRLDDLEQRLQEVLRTGTVEDLDPRELEELLGEEARRNWEQLSQLRQLLEEAGYIKGQERLELTPKGIRKIGQKALREVFVRLKKDRVGDHQISLRGTGGDLLGDTKPYEFGDPFQVHLERTVMNALFRQGPQVPVRLTPQDLEIYRTEHMTRASTVLLLDQSRSMGLFGSFQAAKKVALALYALIHSQFPRDNLYVIGFSDFAQEVREDDLAKLNWNAWVSGTNIHHAFLLSRKLLAKEKGGTRQVVLITDGEPTAHLEGTRSMFSYPPSLKTLQETLKEVRRCTQEGIIINTFMLESSYHLMDFVDKMTRINRGRAFYTTPDRLGQYVLVDYMTSRRKWVS
ncbi:MAG: VWA domain-containing protein [Dehalococcoidia bacterium]